MSIKYFDIIFMIIKHFYYYYCDVFIYFFLNGDSQHCHLFINYYKLINRSSSSNVYALLNTC